MAATSDQSGVEQHIALKARRKILGKIVHETEVLLKINPKDVHEIAAFQINFSAAS